MSQGPPIFIQEELDLGESQTVNSSRNGRLRLRRSEFEIEGLKPIMGRFMIYHDSLGKGGGNYGVMHIRMFLRNVLVFAGDGEHEGFSIQAAVK